jgi:peptide/nickel transport system substrate-binding protein
LQHPKTNVTLASVIGIIVLLLAACGTTTAGEQNPNSGYNFSYTYKTPTKTGGTVVYGTNAIPDSANIIVNRYLNNTVYDAELDDALYSACIIELPDLTLGAKGWINDGCSSVTQSADSSGNTVITLKLDPQAKWSDGAPVTSADWRLGFDASQDPNIGANALSSPYDKATVSFPDPQTFVINYHQVYAAWRIDLATDYYALPSQQYKDSFDPTKYTAGAQLSFAGGANPGKPDPGYNSTVMQADLGVVGSNSHTKADTTQSITNGPFELSGPYTDGTINSMVPNPNYHSSYFHKPVLDKLIFKISTNANAETLAYEAGQYDAAFDFNATNLQSFSGINPNEIIDTPAVSIEYLDFMQRDAAPNAKGTADHHSIFKDENVRKAFEEGFNKCGALEALFGAHGCQDPTLYTDEYTAPPDQNYDPTAPAVKYDVADANKLLDTAGFKIDSNGLRTYPNTSNEVHVVIAAKNNRPVRESMITLMKDELSANLHITAETLSTPKMYSPFSDGGIMTTGACDLCEAGYSGYGEGDQNTTTFDPNQIPSASNQGGPNWMGINDPQITQLLNQGRTTLDPNARVTIYRQFYDYLLEHAITWGLYITPNISLVKTTLGNYKQQATQQGPTWNISDWFTTGNS